MSALRSTGWLFVLGACGVLIPYAVLAIRFDYPGILRRDPGEILMAFHAGGTGLRITWWLFAVLGLPLLVACQQLGRTLEADAPAARWLTAVGTLGLFVQVVGLLRWSFVVPLLAGNYVSGDETTQRIAVALFQLVHQYGGVVLGEHLGQLFTIGWVVGITGLLRSAWHFPAWFAALGYASSAIYLAAQAELFATVLPGFPVWGRAGFVGSTLWLVWLVALGLQLALHPSVSAGRVSAGR
ncbi:uncharacterized protein DUF4386 [Neolewinella xylanilytica]|uniref:Uncharacterized protein DUF4386 n=1 Tax=Neolewinella xylanilytica TaxID=1514080 RepID=A0A2S6I8E9_9BACT|nr:DUF4386 domain-containing protein [Neolewinella xylanilytica]PPK87770.1 uncharacterized protein DUF4386 [Neolewinella xylanilytica]